MRTSSAQKQRAPGTYRSDLDEDVADLSRRILQRLSAAGIDLTIPIELRTDGTGGVAVDDPHPQRAEIEQLIATDSESTIPSTRWRPPIRRTKSCAPKRVAIAGASSA